VNTPDVVMDSRYENPYQLGINAVKRTYKSPDSVISKSNARSKVSIDKSRLSRDKYTNRSGSRLNSRTGGRVSFRGSEDTFSNREVPKMHGVYQGLMGVVNKSKKSGFTVSKKEDKKKKTLKKKGGVVR